MHNVFRPGLAAIPVILSWVLIAFGLFGQTSGIDQLINADSLLPAHLSWDVARHDFAWANFQLPRVLALPDMMFFFAAEWLGVNWRVAFLIFTCLASTAAVAAMAAVIARLQGSAYAHGFLWAGIIMTATLLFAVADLAALPKQPLNWPQLSLLMCVTHGHAFVLSLVTCLTALSAMRGDRVATCATLALCAFGTLSDTIFVGYFLIPFLTAGVALAVRRRLTGGATAPTFGRLARFAALASLACLVGWLAKAPLSMQAMMFEYAGPAKSVTRLVGDLRHAPWIVMLLVLTAGLSVWAIVVILIRQPNPKPPRDDLDRRWLLLTGLAASVLSLGLAAVLYGDYGAYRYAVPFFWWPLMIACGLAGRPGGRAIRSTAVAIATAATALAPLSASQLLHWRTPLERCLTEHRAEWGLQSGLAHYWRSRLTMASSDWGLQVDQIDLDGNAYLWGNDFAAYKHDNTDPRRAPIYNFVVADETFDPFTFETLFQIPARTENCGKDTIWIYDRPIVPPGIDFRHAKSLSFEFIPK